MEQFKVMKSLFDSGEEVFDIKTISEITKLEGKQLDETIKSLCKKKYLKKEGEFYYFTENGRIDFANDFSKRLMVILLLASFTITLILFFLAKIL